MTLTNEKHINRFDVIDYDLMSGDERCFPEVVTREAILYVPQGTKEKYLDKKGWRDFTNIYEKIQTGIKTTMVESTNHSSYYNLNGQLLNTKSKKGVYIQNGKKKVIIE